MMRLYDSTNFPNAEIDGCMCSICQDIIFLPVGSINCSHKYCHSCIDEWLKNNQSCPLCRENFIKFNDVDFENNSLSILKYHCQKGECGESFDVGNQCENIISHNLICPNSNVNCGHCQMECLRKNVDSHQKSRECQMQNQINKLNANLSTIKESFRNLKRKYDEPQNRIYSGVKKPHKYIPW